MVIEKMVAIVTVLILLPAVVAIFCAIYAMIRWMQSRRGSSTKNQLVVGALGPLSLFSSKLMSSDSKKYYSRFLSSVCFFIAYCSLLVLIFKK